MNRHKPTPDWTIALASAVVSILMLVALTWHWDRPIPEGVAPRPPLEAPR